MLASQGGRVSSSAIAVVLVSIAAAGQDGQAAGEAGTAAYGSTVEAIADEVPRLTGIWTSAAELAYLPTSGPAWESMLAEANLPTGTPDIANKDDKTDTRVLAKALVFARTGIPGYRVDVIGACLAAIGTENGGDTLALGRNLLGYVLAADLVELPPSVDTVFRLWLRSLLTKDLGGRTLQSTHEVRPNNWGTHAGASRVAVAAYLGMTFEVEACAQVFEGWLGDRAVYADFVYGALDWQADPTMAVGINPRGATRNGQSIDGVLPDDQRRGGGFTWPPPRVNYVWEALQGAFVQAVILERAGFPMWHRQDSALLRAVIWLHDECGYPAQGDDTWIPHLVNAFYGSSFPAPVPTQPGKNMGWTDWSHIQPRFGEPRELTNRYLEKE